ncbi:MAG TPA: substrate-binding domain-containing protein [Burkholderiales bacterium]
MSIAGAASAADVRVMISAGFYNAYSELTQAFERASGHRLLTTRGPSMGDSPEAIPARLARGEAADVVILDGGAADELGRRGLVRADSKVELARSLIGMVVRAGVAKPDIGSVEAFRSALLAAKSIAYSDSGSGTYLSTSLFAKLGVAFVGTIPAELQPGFSFAGTIASTARQPEAAAALIRFLASPEAAPSILKAGLTPVTGR